MWISFFGVKIRFLVRFRILISLLTPKITENKKKSTKLTFLASVKSECGRGHVRLTIGFKSGRQWHWFLVKNEQFFPKIPFLSFIGPSMDVDTFLYLVIGMHIESCDRSFWAILRSLRNPGTNEVLTDYFIWNKMPLIEKNEISFSNWTIRKADLVQQNLLLLI